MVEFWIGNRARRSTDVLAVHAKKETHQRFRSRENREDVRLLVGDLRAACWAVCQGRVVREAQRALTMPPAQSMRGQDRS